MLPKCLGAVPCKDEGLSSTEESSAAMLEMKVGGSLSVVSGKTTQWLLVPFVPAVDPLKLEKFRSKIREALNLGPSDTITSEAVQEKLKTKDGRKALRGCYNEILSKGGSLNHNEVSMSLYSGPSNIHNRWVRRLRHHAWKDEYFWRPTNVEITPGWIGTGDAKLGDDKQRVEWKQFFTELTPMVGTMLLPHHGSKKNWHSDLLESTGASLLIAAADEETEGYKHPSASVVFDILDAGYEIAHVTKRPRSRLIEDINSRIEEAPSSNSE